MEIPADSSAAAIESITESETLSPDWLSLEGSF